MPPSPPGCLHNLSRSDRSSRAGAAEEGPARHARAAVRDQLIRPILCRPHNTRAAQDAAAMSRGHNKHAGPAPPE